MANAGTVTVDFAAETAKFTAELRKVRTDLKSLKDDTSSLASGMRTAGAALAGLFSAAALGAGIRAVISATRESEQAIAQLESALESAGAAVQLTSRQLQDFATRMQNTSTFTDEAVIGVESVLLSFKGLSGPTILQATQSILDLSARMGTDLTSAAKAVGRALVDPQQGISALTRSGVVFSDEQEKVIKALAQTGDVAGAQQVILRELESRFKGAAEAAGKTFSGALIQAKNAFSDLLEAKTGLPGATAALNELTKTLQSEEVKRGFDAVATGIAKIVEVAAKAITALANLGSEIGRLAAKRIVPDSELTAAQALTKELAFEQRRLAELENLPEQSKRVKRIQDEIASERAYIETLKERIKLAEEAQGKSEFLRNVAPAADSIISGITQASVPKPAIVEPPAFVPRSVIAEEQEFQLEAFRDSLIDQEIAQLAHHQVLLDQQQIFLDATAEMQRVHDEQTSERYVQIETARVEALAAAEQAILQQKQNALQAGIGLLQLLAQRSKTAAIALILINRGLMIAQAVQNTSAAVTKALAIYGPTPQGFAAAAAAKAIGAVEIALIAATGALEIGAASSGRGASVVGPGTPHNPIFTQNGEDERAAGASSQGVVQVIVQGNIFSSEQTAQWMLEQISEAVNGRDVVIIDQNSRQGQELLGD